MDKYQHWIQLIDSYIEMYNSNIKMYDSYIELYNLLCKVEFLYCTQAQKIEPNTPEKALAM